eukprot:Skav200867  [mRNA]  locus=scaffold3562:4095:8433:- [translate_table: standard]
MSPQPPQPTGEVLKSPSTLEHDGTQSMASFRNSPRSGDRMGSSEYSIKKKRSPSINMGNYFTREEKKETIQHANTVKGWLKKYATILVEGPGHWHMKPF